MHSRTIVLPPAIPLAISFCEPIHCSLTSFCILTADDRFEKDMRLKEDTLKTVFDMDADISHRMG